jgi:hypothetical protein
MIECPKCKQDNDLGRIFCIKCGEKLDISKVRPPSGVVRWAKSGHRSLPMGKVIANGFNKLIQVVLLAIVMAFLTLVLLPADVQHQSFGDHNVDSYQTKRTELDEGTLNEKGVSVVFEEADLNAALAQLVKKQQDGSDSKIPIRLESMYISLKDGSLTVTSQNKWKWYSLYAQVELKPVTKNGKCAFDVVSAHIGRFRIPPEVPNGLAKVQATFGTFFSGLEAEKVILDKVGSIVVKPGQAIVSTVSKTQ